MAAAELPLVERLSVRFSVTLATNVVKAALSFASSLVLARVMGPSGFGDLSFLLVSFAAINKLLDMGTSSAFYTLIARRRRAASFYAVYAGWLALQFAVAALLVGLVLPGPVVSRIWLGHDRGTILLALVAAFAMNQVWNATSQAGESIRRTVEVQVRNVALNVAYLAAIVLLAASGDVSVRALLLVNAVLYLAFAAATAAWLRRRLVDADARETPREGVADIARLAAPLVVGTVASFASLFGDAWMVTHFGGVDEQGYFAAAERFSAVALLATTAMVPLFWKEIGEAAENGDHARLSRLRRRTTSVLFFVSALAGVFLALEAPDVVEIALGSAYAAGALAFGVMMLYPLAQTLTQLHGSYLYATGRTAAYRNFVLAAAAGGLAVTYLLTAPATAPVPGLGLGALGLAVKMVLVTLVLGVAQSWWVARSAGDRTGLVAPFVGALVLLAGAALARLASQAMLDEPLPRVVVAGLLYTPVAVALVLVAPSCAGLEREDIARLSRILRP